MEYKRIDFYDSRVTSPISGNYNAIGSSNIPLAVMNGLLAPKLGLDSSRMYYTGNLNVFPNWNYSTENSKTHIECLGEALLREPGSQVLFASGLYDLCTLAGNTRYILAHSNLPKNQVTHMEYLGGHGVYSSPESKSKFLNDIRSLISGTI